MQETQEKYSYSKISTYKQCKFKYKLRYFDKNFLYSTNIATDFGSLIHKTEENIALSILNNNSINYCFLKNNFIIQSKQIAHIYGDVFYKPDKSGNNYLEKTYMYLDYGIHRLEKFLNLNTNLQLIGAEQKFIFNYDDEHVFSGSIDRAFLDINTNNILIQDIKSWGVPAQQKDLKLPLQFVVYALAAENLWNVKPENVKCEYDLPLCDLTQQATSNTLIGDGKTAIDKLFKGIEKQDFKPTISALCHWCEYNPLVNTQLLSENPAAICPYFSTWQKSGDSVKDTLITWQDLDSVEVDRQFCISQLKQKSI